MEGKNIKKKLSEEDLTIVSGGTASSEGNIEAGTAGSTDIGISHTESEKEKTGAAKKSIKQYGREDNIKIDKLIR